MSVRSLSALAALALVPLTAAAQYIPPDVKGFQRQQMMQQARQRAAAQPTAPPVVRAPVFAAPTTAMPEVRVAITIPQASQVLVPVTLVGPDGIARTFYQAAPPVIVVTPGQSFTVVLPGYHRPAPPVGGLVGGVAGAAH